MPSRARHSGPSGRDGMIASTVAARSATGDTPELADGLSRETRLVGIILGIAVTIGALLTGFILLYVNFPAGSNVAYGLSKESLPLFRGQWPYPTLALDPRSFGQAAALVIVLLWATYLASCAVLGRCRLPSTRRQ